MKKRIAIIDVLGSHGSSHHFYLSGQIAGIADSIDVNLYTNNRTEIPDIENLKCYYFFKDLFVSRYRIISFFKWTTGMIRSILHARISSVKVFHFHVFNTNILVLIQLILVKMLFAKTVLTIHDVIPLSEKKYSSILAKWIYRLTDIIFTHNSFSKNEIIKISNKLNIHVIPHGNYIPFINFKYNTLESRNYLGVHKAKNILLFFGMIKEVKGLDILLESLDSVLKLHPNTILIIAGKPWKNDFSSYNDIINKHNLRNNCILHIRFIPNHEVGYYYTAADLVILPYKRIYQSGVLMMTLSYKRPVLVSDLPVFKEIISNKNTGFFFKSENAASLSMEINRLLANKKILKKVAKNGAELVEKNYDWNDIGLLSKEIYSTIF